ncbi:MAG: hypothetical protein LBH71_02880, partial [Oscillospiraceae bacterium]|nr:hypothetical protein [Oscillospiraceae bacterium]
MQSLLNRDISPSCKYCLLGRMSPDKKSILCVKRGVMSLESSCRRFKYDPLKRQPPRLPKIGQFSREDFE